MSTVLQPDLVVVGSGAAGLGAATAAAAAGRRVVLVEREARTGGDCTHFGCVPSKALLETARRVAAARDGARYGFTADPVVDFAAVMERVAAVVTAVAADESPAVLAQAGVEVRRGHAVLVGGATVRLDDGPDTGLELRARRVVLAVGAGPALPPLPGLDSVAVLTNRTVFDLRGAPGHLLVLGGGPVGCELAQAFSRLGVPVTLIEAADRLVAREEPEAAAVLTAALRADGVTVRTGAGVVQVAGDGAPGTTGVTVTLADGTSVTGTHLLVAGGRRPDTTGMGLAEAGVRLDPRSGRIEVDDHLQTTVPEVFAVGDCAAALQLTHVAHEQGRLAARNAFSRVRGRFSSQAVPWATFTDPEIGRVGLTEEQAFAQFGSRARVVVVPMSGQDRARAAGDTTGFVKLIAAPATRRGGARGGGSGHGPAVTDRLVGMTAVAPVGGELVAEAALAMRAGVLAARLAQTVHAYPTWSLTTRVAAGALFGVGDGARPATATPPPLPGG